MNFNILIVSLIIFLKTSLARDLLLGFLSASASISFLTSSRVTLGIFRRDKRYRLDELDRLGRNGQSGRSGLSGQNGLNDRALCPFCPFCPLCPVCPISPVSPVSPIRPLSPLCPLCPFGISPSWTRGIRRCCWFSSVCPAASSSHLPPPNQPQPDASG